MWQRSGHPGHSGMWLVALTCTTAMSCAAPAQQGGTSSSTAQPGIQQTRGTLTLASSMEPETLHPKFLSGSGNGEYAWVFSSSLSFRDFEGVSRPLLAQELPTQANGSWVINPDGTMVTTYLLRPKILWHDGTPLTAHDFVFAHEVYLDPDLPTEKPHFERMMERVEARDDRTLAITWKESYVGANRLGHQQLNPLPRHIFEGRYRNSRENFIHADEWTRAYVGTGPFKMESWSPGSQIVARANMDFVLGPPKLDTLIIRFMFDQNVALASLMAGEVDMVTSPSMRAPEAAIARDQWAQNRDGYIKAWSTRTSYIEFQFREVPGWERAISDPRVRRALIHALDRQGIAETVNLGFAPPADSFIAPSDQIFQAVDRALIKYPYDPSRATAVLAEAGWTRPPGRDLLANATGDTLDGELHASLGNLPSAQIITDNWKSVGVNSSIFPIPPARERDTEMRAHFKATGLNGRTIAPEQFIWTCDRFPTRENGWTGSNRGAFCDAEADRLQSIRMGSLDDGERREATITLMRRMSELVGAMPVIFAVEVIIARS
ncbi:MAG: hypothetical protein HW416_2655, partial [Chloroflexi bacterium]|nr:hypothetical protein [Chloroflexota bacterium]